MGAISPGAGSAIRTQSSSPSSCSSKRRSPPSYLIITSGSAHFPISPHWRALRKMRCFARGKASAITLAREISTRQQRSLWIDTADNSRGQSIKCSDFPESANIPRTLSPALLSINLFQSSKRTPLAFWRGSLICANQSIPTWAGKSFGNKQRVLFQNPMPRLSTPHFSISARSFA